MKIRDTATGKVFDLPKSVATGLARSRSNTYELVTGELAPPTGQTDGSDTGDTAVPTSSSTVAQLKKYAKEHDIDLGGATKKPGIWAAVSAALEAGKPDHDPAADGGSDDSGNETGDASTGQDAGADDAGND